jgi:hypothetical protein
MRPPCLYVTCVTVPPHPLTLQPYLRVQRARRGKEPASTCTSFNRHGLWPWYNRWALIPHAEWRARVNGWGHCPSVVAAIMGACVCDEGPAECSSICVAAALLALEQLECCRAFLSLLPPPLNTVVPPQVPLPLQLLLCYLRPFPRLPRLFLPLPLPRWPVDGLRARRQEMRGGRCGRGEMRLR